MPILPYDKPLAECTVAVVGLGLMGGSLALALQGKARRVVGIARRRESIEQALLLRAIDAGYQTLADGLPEADIIVLATPIRVILKQIGEIGRLAACGQVQEGVLLMDLGSTKRHICEAMARLPTAIQPVGGHPMCGKELSGLDVAEATLFRGAPFVLCRLERTVPEALALAEALTLAIEACPVQLDPDRHDWLVAAISHLPYLLSVALFATAEEIGQEDEMVWQLAASGFRSTTRLAGSHVTMMTDILLTNPEAVLATMARLRRVLDELAGLLHAGKEHELRRALWRVRALREEFLEQYGP